MATRKYTTLLVLAALAVLIGWDLLMAINHVHGDTISEITYAFARVHPFVPLWLGAVAGHFFWSSGWRGQNLAPFFIVMLGFTGLDVAHSWAAWHDPFWASIQAWPLGTFLIGMGIGHTMWPNSAAVEEKQ